MRADVPKCRGPWVGYELCRGITNCGHGYAFGQYPHAAYDKAKVVVALTRFESDVPLSVLHNGVFEGRKVGSKKISTR
jgi:hypothetical protein